MSKRSLHVSHISSHPASPILCIQDAGSSGLRSAAAPAQVSCPLNKQGAMMRTTCAKQAHRNETRQTERPRSPADFQQRPGFCASSRPSGVHIPQCSDAAQAHIPILDGQGAQRDRGCPVYLKRAFTCWRSSVHACRPSRSCDSHSLSRNPPLIGYGSVWDIVHVLPIESKTSILLRMACTLDADTSPWQALSTAAQAWGTPNRRTGMRPG